MPIISIEILKIIDKRETQKKNTRGTKATAKGAYLYSQLKQNYY